MKNYKEYTELETLTAEIANDVVNRVTVYKDGGIEIELALRDELENNKANKHFKFISSLKEEYDLGRIKKQILEYHSMHGGLTAEEERFKMNLDEKWT